MDKTICIKLNIWCSDEDATKILGALNSMCDSTFVAQKSLFMLDDPSIPIVGEEQFRPVKRAYSPAPQPEHKSIEEIAKLFHETYERLAPQYGYETRADTKEFDKDSPNGKLMIAVIAELIPHLNSRNLLEWATGNDTGVSSVALLRYMMGFEPNDWGFMAPSDRDDRGRCIRLLKKFPEWLDRLDEMKKFSGWKEQIPLIKDEFIESELGK